MEEYLKEIRRGIENPQNIKTQTTLVGIYGFKKDNTSNPTYPTIETPIILLFKLMLKIIPTRLIVIFQLMLTLQMTNQELNRWLVHTVAKEFYH